MAQIINFFIHIITFLFILIPLFLLYRIKSKEYSKLIGIKSKNKLIKSLNLIVLGFIPIALIHLFEALSVYGINILPHETTLFHMTAEHLALIIAFISISFFLLKFEQTLTELKDALCK